MQLHGRVALVAGVDLHIRDLSRHPLHQHGLFAERHRGRCSGEFAEGLFEAVLGLAPEVQLTADPEDHQQQHEAERHHSDDQATPALWSLGRDPTVIGPAWTVGRSGRWDRGLSGSVVGRETVRRHLELGGVVATLRPRRVGLLAGPDRRELVGGRVRVILCIVGHAVRACSISTGSVTWIGLWGLAGIGSGRLGCVGEIVSLGSVGGIGRGLPGLGRFGVVALIHHVDNAWSEGQTG